MSGFENRVPPGWYPDQRMAGTDRYWDGDRWTDQVKPAEPVRPAANFEPPNLSNAPLQNPGLSDRPDFDPPAPHSAPQGQSDRKPRNGRVIGLTLIGIVSAVVLVLVLLLILALFLVRGSSDAVQGAQLGENRSTDSETAEEIDDDSIVIGEDEPGELGTRENPLPYDTESQLRFETFGEADGSIWLTTIGPPRDITAEVKAENQFNEEPPDGVVFVGFDASMTLFRSDKEPLAPGFNFAWEIFGGQTAVVYQVDTIDTNSFGCGVVPGEFDNFSEVFEGGTVSGTVCIPLPIEDLEDNNTQVAIHFIDDSRAIFGP